MEELTLTTPSILFSAISLIMLAYTNRFLSYASLIRSMSEDYSCEPTNIKGKQIDNLRKRLHMTRWMQILGIFSLFLCVVCTFLIYIGRMTGAIWIFGIALLSLTASLAISIMEIHISAKALDIHLDSMKKN